MSEQGQSGAEFLDDFPKWETAARVRTVGKLTPLVRARLVEGVLAGLNRAEAATRAGIAPQTFAKWLKRGENRRHGPEHDLVMIIQAADAQLEYLLVKAIRGAAFGGDWRAAEALLKRRFPDRWGDRQRIDHRLILEEATKLAEQYPEFSVEEIVAEAEGVLRESRS